MQPEPRGRVSARLFAHTKLMMREEVRTKGFAARLYNFCMGKFIGTATVTSTATEADGVVEPVCGGGGEGDGEASVRLSAAVRRPR